ncbi:MAG: DUF1080 domain-containing protein [Candidatus Nealsonbacteria bacterium]|nr:DUF1080 domain-containing protein [Candidatus Nealsonbacteria bacterium]
MLSKRWRFTAVAMVATLFPMTAGADEWKSLFDGKKLGKWVVVDKFDFINHGKVEVKDGQLLVGKGNPGTGIRYTGEFPKVDYELELEAMRVEGDDFFCAVTFHVGKASQSLIVGGWRGPVVGLSCIDDEPAVENETCVYKEFQKKRWYKIRLRVTEAKVEAWIDKEQVVDFTVGDHKLTIYFEPETMLPLGIATWETTGALRNIRVRKIKVKK